MLYKNEKKIAVLLSTYNGELFIREQLQSLTVQVSTDFHVYIRDDGSSDETLTICNEFATQFPIFTIMSSIEGNIGVVQSFSRLAEHVESEYYMFCDQDDIWLPNKIDNIYKYCLENETDYNTPILCYSDLKTFDGAKINEWSFLEKIKAPLNLQFDDLVFRASVWGCTVIFNKALRDLGFPCPKSIRYHDSWLTQLAFLSGTVLFYNSQDIIYRIHSNNNSNPLEIMNKKGLIKKIKNAIEPNEKEIKRLTLRINQLILAIKRADKDKQKQYHAYIKSMTSNVFIRVLYFAYSNALDKKTIFLSPTILRAVISFKPKL